MNKSNKVNIFSIIIEIIAVLVIIFIVGIIFSIYRYGIGPGVTDGSTNIKINQDYVVENISADEVILVNKNPNDLNGLVVSEGKIVKLNWNDTYIIVEQQQVEDFEPIDKYLYYIVEMNTEKLYGPYDEEMYDNKLSELGIDLKLEKVSDLNKIY